MAGLITALLLGSAWSRSARRLTKIAKALDVPRKKLLDMDEEITEEPTPIRVLQKKLRLVPKFQAADQQDIAKMIDMLAVKNGIKPQAL